MRAADLVCACDVRVACVCTAQLVLSSGLWDVQDGSAADYAASVPQLIGVLRRRFPETMLLWVSPLPTTPTVHTWRTAHRLAQHTAIGLGVPLRRLGVPLLNLLPTFSAVPSADGRHYEMRFYADALSILLNEWARLAGFDAQDLMPSTGMASAGSCER